MTLTPVQAYIKALKNYKKINGTLDDAIVLAETLLIESEKKHLIDANQDGIDMVIGEVSFSSGEEYYSKKYKNNENDMVEL